MCHVKPFPIELYHVKPYSHKVVSHQTSPIKLYHIKPFPIELYHVKPYSHRFLLCQNLSHKVVSCQTFSHKVVSCQTFSHRVVSLIQQISLHLFFICKTHMRDWHDTTLWEKVWCDTTLWEKFDVIQLYGNKVWHDTTLWEKVWHDTTLWEKVWHDTTLYCSFAVVNQVINTRSPGWIVCI
jgi:hypothetical protein